VSDKRVYYCEWAEDGGHRTIGFRMADGSLQIYVDARKLRLKDKPGRVLQFPRAKPVGKTGS
jgi:hypothetical protein